MVRAENWEGNIGFHRNGVALVNMLQRACYPLHPWDDLTLLAKFEES